MFLTYQLLYWEYPQLAYQDISMYSVAPPGSAGKATAATTNNITTAIRTDNNLRMQVLLSKVDQYQRTRYSKALKTANKRVKRPVASFLAPKFYHIPG